MRRVYNYSLIKHLKSKSTWIIFAVTTLIVFFFTSFIFFNYRVGGKNWYFDNYKPLDNNNNINWFFKSQIAFIILYQAHLGSVAMLLGIFVAFKSGGLIRDEIEDSSFLLIISKPLNRMRIISGKLLALFTVIIGFTLFVAFVQVLGVKISDSSHEKFMNFKLFVHSIGYLFGIYLTIATVFMSLGVFFSSITSSGLTIGLVIGISTYIPISSLIENVIVEVDHKDLNFVSRMNKFEEKDYDKIVRRIDGKFSQDINQANQVLVKDNLMNFILQGPDMIAEKVGFAADVIQKSLEIIPVNYLNDASVLRRAFESKLVESLLDSDNIYLKKVDIFDEKYGFKENFFTDSYPANKDYETRLMYVRDRSLISFRVDAKSSSTRYLISDLISVSGHFRSLTTPMTAKLFENDFNPLTHDAFLNAVTTRRNYYDKSKKPGWLLEFKDEYTYAQKLALAVHKTTDFANQVLKTLSSLTPGTPEIQQLSVDEVFGYFVKTASYDSTINRISDFFGKLSFTETVKELDERVGILNAQLDSRYIHNHLIIYAVYLSFSFILLVAGTVIMTRQNYR